MRSETMTDEQIVEAVATRVMGWRSEIVKDPVMGEVFANYVDASGRGIMRPGDFSPLADHNHAMQVVEKMRERGWWWSGYGNSLTTTVKDVCFTFQKDEDTDSQTKFKVYSPTLPRAICLSALAAVKGEGK